jgi:hypothetical protein
LQVSSYPVQTYQNICWLSLLQHQGCWFLPLWNRVYFDWDFSVLKKGLNCIKIKDSISTITKASEYQERNNYSPPFSLLLLLLTLLEFWVLSILLYVEVFVSPKILKKQ